jgi:hypothetical protein
MGSITQKGKPSDHGSISTANASNSQVSATATPGIGNFILPTVFFCMCASYPQIVTDLHTTIHELQAKTKSALFLLLF